MTKHRPSNSDPLRTALEPRRMEILQLIWDRELSVTDIAAPLPVSIAAVSQHLTKLRSVGLVQVRVEGRHRYYRASRDDMGTIAVVLESFWADRLNALAKLAHSLDADSSPSSPTPLASPGDSDE